MGEAKRRKKLDSSYGKVPYLRISGYQEKHFQKVIDDLHSQCESELKTLTAAKKIPDNYQQIRSQLARCLENLLSKYREEDREMIASYIFLVFSQISEDYDLSPITIVCFWGILKSYLSLELYEKLADYMENIIARFSAESELISTP